MVIGSELRYATLSIRHWHSRILCTLGFYIEMTFVPISTGAQQFNSDSTYTSRLDSPCYSLVSISLRTCHRIMGMTVDCCSLRIRCSRATRDHRSRRRRTWSTIPCGHAALRWSRRCRWPPTTNRKGCQLRGPTRTTTCWGCCYDCKNKTSI